MTTRRIRAVLTPMFWSLSFDLIISLTIICALVALYIARVDGYVGKARVSEIMLYTSPIRIELIVGRAVRGQWPELDDVPVATDTSHARVHDVLHKDGHFNAVFELPGVGPSSASVPYNLSFRRVTDASEGTIWWACGYRTPTDGRKLTIANITDVPRAYLTGVCR